VFDNRRGVQNEQEYWLAPLTEAANPDARWQLLAARSDNVTGIEMRGEEIFLLSHQDAPTFKILTLRAGQKLAAAATLVPARSDRVIESIHAASDGLYVLERDGIYSRLLRVAANSNAVRDIPLPFKGYISAAFSDPRHPGLTLTLESWAVPATEFTYEPSDDRFVDLKLEARPHYDPAQFTVRDLQAKAADGTEIPLTLVEPKHGQEHAQEPQIVLLDAYGSYGISILPEFSARMIVLIQEGADYAVCHVRGGGELGEAWRLGGKDANKPNTWRDLIACGEDLIARRITTKDHLFVIGGSAGGITMGRAMTERPDLFAGVIDQVPASNTLREEFSPNGPPNVPEFGTVSTEEGFRNLLAMDSYQAVKSGTRYPAVLITTGLNDPRVAPWEPAKLAARLQASDTTAPVLLRVEEEAGHGVGSTKTQRDQEFADIASFIFWRAGRPGWRPDLSVH
jgi:prolyl oligopeptidase